MKMSAAPLLLCLRQPLAERVDKKLKAVDKNKLL